MADKNKLRGSPKRPVMASDREILAALLRSTVSADEPEKTDWAWKHLRFDPDTLAREMVALLPSGHQAKRAQAHALARRLAAQYELRQARVDNLRFNLLRREWQISRTLVGEALGAFGSTLFHTRRRSQLSAIEAARELAYFGYESQPSEALSPLTYVRTWLSGENPTDNEPIFLEEQYLDTTRRWTALDLLALDPVNQGRPPSTDEMAGMQKRLRQEPLDGAMVSKLREFFSRRATAGVRDTARWALGSRHPWFGWPRARDLIVESFEHWGDENFFSWRTYIYYEDPLVPAEERARMQKNNRRAVKLLANSLGAALNSEVQVDLPAERLHEISELALDYQYDYPDFDLEALGTQPGTTTANLIGRAAKALTSRLRGGQLAQRCNKNTAGLFSFLGLNAKWLSAFDDHQRERFFEILGNRLETMQQQGGLPEDEGELVNYERPHMILLSFVSTKTPQARPGERLLDSFRLSQLRAPQFAGYLRTQPELGEKLVVFFALVLRHYLDNAHLPDLRPEDWLRDYWLLGLWGNCAENVWVNLYKNEKTGQVRSEVRLLGGDHQKTYRPDPDRAHEAELLSKAAALLGPDPEQSILRALASFLMALQENQEGSRLATLDRVAILKQTLEVFRETARTGVRGTLVDVATTFELIVDNAVDSAQRGLSRLERLSRKDRSDAAHVKEER